MLGHSDSPAVGAFTLKVRHAGWSDVGLSARCPRPWRPVLASCIASLCFAVYLAHWVLGRACNGQLPPL